jgi:hypothetical protein
MSHDYVVDRIYIVRSSIIKVSKQLVDEPYNETVVQPPSLDCVNQNLTAQRPLSPVALNGINRESSLLQNIAEPIFRKTKEVIRHFVEMPIHRARQDKSATALQKPKRLSNKTAMIGDMFYDLGAKDRVEAGVLEGDLGRRADNVNPSLT